MKVYQIYVHVSPQARAKLSFRARARAFNDTQDPTVGPSPRIRAASWKQKFFQGGSKGKVLALCVLVR